MPKVKIYTDGACRGNPGPGGWGVLLQSGDAERELYGAESSTTNNRMELTAAIEALHALTKPCHVLLFTDSIYVRDGIESWIEKWKKNSWKNARRQPVKNRDLWERLDLLRRCHRIEWRWVKGHAGNAGNERADGLANKAIDELT